MAAEDADRIDERQVRALWRLKAHGSERRRRQQALPAARILERGLEQRPRDSPTTIACSIGSPIVTSNGTQMSKKKKLMHARPQACHSPGPERCALTWMPAMTRLPRLQLDAAVDVDEERERHEDDERVVAQPAVDVEARLAARRARSSRRSATSST